MKMPKQIWNSFNSARPRAIYLNRHFMPIALNLHVDVRLGDFCIVKQIEIFLPRTPGRDEGSRLGCGCFFFPSLLPFMLRSLLQRDHANPSTTTSAWLCSCCPALAAMQSPRDVWGPEVVQLVRNRAERQQRPYLDAACGRVRRKRAKSQPFFLAIFLLITSSVCAPFWGSPNPLLAAWVCFARGSILRIRNHDPIVGPLCL